MQPILGHQPELLMVTVFVAIFAAICTPPYAAIFGNRLLAVLSAIATGGACVLLLAAIFNIGDGLDRRGRRRRDGE